jgi:hypothetical protein
MTSGTVLLTHHRQNFQIMLTRKYICSQIENNCIDKILIGNTNENVGKKIMKFHSDGTTSSLHLIGSSNTNY